jgi:DNA-binding MarR family transcriptional regulator
MGMSGPVHLPCLCATVRRAARTLTSLYDEVLRKHSITITQFTILQALQLAGPVAQGRLGEILAIDSTTLSRSLRPLVKNGWVSRAAGDDRRAWSLSLSKQGRLAYETALPDWEAAQRALRKKLGPDGWNNSFQSSDQLTTAAQSIGANK